MEPSENRSAETTPDSFYDRYPWIPFVVPFVVYMALNSLEPAAPTGKAAAEKTQAAAAQGAEPTNPGKNAEEGKEARVWLDLGIEYRHYPLAYSAKIAITTLVVLLMLPAYRRIPFSVNPLAGLIGIAGVVVWVGLCKLGLERKLLEPLGLGGVLDFGVRSGFNPLVELKDQPAAAWGFLAIRFFGLVIIVAVIEEMFLRGFVYRYLIEDRWWELPFGTRDLKAAAITTAVFVLMHPAELLAAIAWFCLVTWLLFRTRNIWDCVAAHAVTNALLGVYVLASGDWWLM